MGYEPVIISLGHQSKRVLKDAYLISSKLKGLLQVVYIGMQHLESILYQGLMWQCHLMSFYEIILLPRKENILGGSILSVF